MRLLGDLDLADDCCQDAFASALAVWPESGIPAKPLAWLVKAGRYAGLNTFRKNQRQVALPAEELVAFGDEPDIEIIDDDALRLIFMCCHPSLGVESQIALTLRECCGLSTEEIAHAFLCPMPTLAQRIVRAKAQLKAGGHSLELLNDEVISERLPGVLHVLYLTFNEGYYASSGYSLVRADLAREAIRLTRLVVSLLRTSETVGLLALMLVQESRRSARTNAEGDIILLDDQDRRLWNQAMAREGILLSDEAVGCSSLGSYALQSAIAAVHARSPESDSTDWGQIVGYYDQLQALGYSPIVELNRAVAVAYHVGPEHGIEIIERMLAEGELAHYGLAYSALGGLKEKLGQLAEAVLAYEVALAKSNQDSERKWLREKIENLQKSL